MPAPKDLKIYVTGHFNSQVVCKAVATGSGGQIVPATALLDGPAAVYGILRGCDLVVQQCQWVGRDWYHVDHGYFRRGNGDFRGYYRVTKNALQRQSRGIDLMAEDRWKELKIELRPWRKQGVDVVVAPLSRALGQFLDIDPGQWMKMVIAEIQQYTDRAIVIKAKDSEASIQDTLRQAWCLVTHSSNAAIDALIEGVPIFTTGECGAKPLASGPLCNIEKPSYPERGPWFRVLADSQWTLAEIQRGRCWERM